MCGLRAPCISSLTFSSCHGAKLLSRTGMQVHSWSLRWSLSSHRSLCHLSLSLFTSQCCQRNGCFVLLPPSLLSIYPSTISHPAPSSLVSFPEKPACLFPSVCSQPSRERAVVYFCTFEIFLIIKYFLPGICHFSLSVTDKGNTEGMGYKKRAVKTWYPCNI